MMKSMISFKTLLPGFFMILLICFDTNAQTTWPKEISSTDGSRITIYEPVAEQYSENKLYARAAVSIRKNASEEPIFGVMWINAAVQPDGQNKFLKVTNLTVAKAKFADDDDTSPGQLQTAVERSAPGLNIQFSLDKVNTALEQGKMTGDNNFKNDAPTILYRNKPTTLIVLDGEPLEQQDDDLGMTRVVNSPYLILKNPDDRKYYLYGGSFWYASTGVLTGWKNVTKLPSRIKAVDAKMKEEENKASKEQDETSKFTKPTDILVSTEPAELIQTEGTPTYKAVEGSTLLYVDNSLDEIFKDIESQRNYILIAGRWYSSKTLTGQWAYVEPESLPAAFANIPEGSEKDGVLASVAGTPEADEALMDASIPQTAKVDRTSATCEVNYDGAPRFVPIANTNLAVAENSDLTVMLAPNNQYYALENGIWFISNNANGPWQVANERPSDVERIPANSSAYNARFVQIYETTPQYVYVGYTPGYMGNYIYHRTVVWGTGYRYRPWYGRRFYPRPYTWGFGMHYNPWTGWSISFGLGFNTGWYRYSRYHRDGGWFGPPMYRPPYRSWGWNGGYYGNKPGNRPQYRPNVSYNRPVNWNRPPVARPVRSNINIYENRRNVVTRDKILRPVTRPGTSRPSDPGTRPVYRPDPNPGNEPGTRPTTPIERPDRRPTNPVERPDRRPTNPVTRPTSPIERPTRPVERPTNRPTTPVERPATPVTRPAIPESRPTRPIERPVTRPSVPAQSRPETRPVPLPRSNRPEVSRPANNAPANRTPASRPANPRNRNN
jgi:hypothetical protein